MVTHYVGQAIAIITSSGLLPKAKASCYKLQTADAKCPPFPVNPYRTGTANPLPTSCSILYNGDTDSRVMVQGDKNPAATQPSLSGSQIWIQVENAIGQRPQLTGDVYAMRAQYKALDDQANATRVISPNVTVGMQEQASRCYPRAEDSIPLSTDCAL